MTDSEETELLTLIRNYVINDNITLATGAYIRVTEAINSESVVTIVPVTYPATGSQLKVVEFATGLTCSTAKFDIVEEQKADYRLKAIGQTVVICDAEFNLVLNANGGSVTSTHASAVKDGENVVLQVKYNTIKYEFK